MKVVLAQVDLNMNEKIKLNSRWFALTADNHKGVEHTVVSVESEPEEGGVMTEREITTWSKVDCDKFKDGRVWVGPESQFVKLFKFIGFSK